MHPILNWLHYYFINISIKHKMNPVLDANNKNQSWTYFNICIQFWTHYTIISENISINIKRIQYCMPIINKESWTYFNIGVQFWTHYIIILRIHQNKSSIACVQFWTHYIIILRIHQNKYKCTIANPVLYADNKNKSWTYFNIGLQSCTHFIIYFKNPSNKI